MANTDHCGTCSQEPQNNPKKIEPSQKPTEHPLKPTVNQ